MWQGLSIGLFGIWILATSLLKIFPVAFIWNDLIVGMVVIYLSSSIIIIKPLMGSATFLTGVWVLFTMFIPSFPESNFYLLNETICSLSLTLTGFIVYFKKTEKTEVTRAVFAKGSHFSLSTRLLKMNVTKMEAQK